MHKFKNPPLISVTAYGNPSLLNSVIGAHQYYSYVPHYYLHYENDMNIWQRLYNFVVHIVELYDRGAVFNPKLDKLMKEKFGSNYPTITELEQRTAIAFVNTHPSYQVAAPLPENVIAVGGLHIRETKPLPKDLQDFIASSNKGAILFSLGTFVRTSLMDIEKQKIILDAFEQLPDYHFLWKFEEQTIDIELPKNVIIRPWLPQSDILAHPKVKAFFSHCGLLSTQEAIYRGVPILGIPIAYDQKTNLLKSIQLGFAEGINFQTMTTEIIKEKLQQILEDPKYLINMKKVSTQFRDQKEKPIDRAIWWTEWVLRNPNADFLKSPVLRLGFISGNSYDVIAIITIVLAAISLLVAKLLISYIRQVVLNWNQTYNHTKSDILAHPRIKAFIPHSGNPCTIWIEHLFAIFMSSIGLLSTHEAIYKGVPTIGIPFSSERKRNLLKCIRLGFAEELNFQTMTTEIVKEKLKQVLKNSKYSENAKKMLANVNAANILILSALPSYSHHKWNSVIGRALGSRNHNVTILSPYFVKNPPNGVQYLHTDIRQNDFEEYMNKALRRREKLCTIIELFKLAVLTRKMCFSVLQTAAFHQLLDYPHDSFDLIIHDFTGGPCLMPFLHKFKKALLVVATPFSYSTLLSSIIGGHEHYAYVSHTVLAYNTTMTFWQRFINFSVLLAEHFVRQYIILDELDMIMPKYFGSDLPPISQLEKRAKLALINAHPIIDNLGPMLPTVISIAGIHIGEVNDMPMDLELFLNSSKKGAVLFSLGSCIRSDNVPIDKLRLFLDVFSELTNYNFVWKFESNFTSEDLPSNVQILPWIPQADVLAHPKLKAFITHGGLLSLLESIHRGVPMVVIPFLLDQNANMNKMKKLRIAESLDFYSLSFNGTKETLLKVLEDPTYSANVKKLSNVLHDQSEKPLDRAIFWIEWLLRYPNIDNMQSPVQTLGYIVGNSFDIIAFVTIVFVCHIIILIVLFYFGCKKCARRHSNKQLKSYNEKKKQS
ncbi:uncharacterized protein LOC116347346 [Contarinia nasturtii]|uniref:uncharacterized protein LOC116347346 n=1 Tax=Contarinia nasturtii TaxID=265458 RepID=UPI0012D462C7|nr:uncharacterized protein LOC116347346 [Contarinia nasturtii]